MPLLEQGQYTNACGQDILVKGKPGNGGPQQLPPQPIFILIPGHLSERVNKTRPAYKTTTTETILRKIFIRLPLLIINFDSIFISGGRTRTDNLDVNSVLLCH